MKLFRFITTGKEYLLKDTSQGPCERCHKHLTRVHKAYNYTDSKQYHDKTQPVPPHTEVFVCPLCGYILKRWVKDEQTNEVKGLFLTRKDIVWRVQNRPIYDSMGKDGKITQKRIGE